MWSSHDLSIPQDWLRLQPTCHHGDPQLDALCERFLNSNPYANSELFYLWGHAYEFEAADNWDLIRRFADRMGKHPEIWYATNIAVHDYVEAWRCLRVSADGRTVQNPTATLLWAETEGGIREIPAGATVAVR